MLPGLGRLDATIANDNSSGNTISLVSTGVVAVPVSSVTTFPVPSARRAWRETELHQEEHTSSANSRSYCVPGRMAALISLGIVLVFAGGVAAYLCLSGRCNIGSTLVVVNKRQSAIPCNGTEQVIENDPIAMRVTMDVDLTPCHGHSNGRRTNEPGRWFDFVAGAGSNTVLIVCSTPDRVSGSVWVGCDVCAPVVREGLNRTGTNNGLSVYCQEIRLETIPLQTYTLLLYGSNIGFATVSITSS